MMYMLYTIVILQLLFLVSSTLIDDKYGPSADSLQISPSVTRGMVIDAGSTGSRLHVYNWAPRVFDTIPPNISYPTSDEHWTARMSPGISTFSDYNAVIQHLSPLIDFAKNALVGLEDQFQYFPIYFKATGGMRELSVEKREQIMNWVRKLLSDDFFSPFYFQSDMARVISGEEEAIFSWAAINMLMGTLLPASQGTGEARPINGTYGTLDLGGSSSQIAFFVPSQDISEGLFKLQIGSQKHWNVYTKSFLSFGQVSARNRYLKGLADSVNMKTDKSVISYCFHSGYSENVVLKDSNYKVEVKGPALPSADQFKICSSALMSLLQKENEGFCQVTYDNQCSIYGAYQPALPPGQKFIGTSSYKYAWNILMLPATSSLGEYKKNAQNICSLSFADIMSYSDSNNLSTTDEKLSEIVPYFCFLSAYTYVLLVHGYGFTDDSSITVLDQVNGNKVGWALGAILYEINTLPWELAQRDVKIGEMIMSSCIGAIIGALLMFFFSKELLTTEHSKRYRVDIENDLELQRKDNWSSQIKQFNPFDIKYQYSQIPDSKK